MSKSILISLIGKQTIPNYRVYKEFMPDVLVHLYSDDTEKEESILAKMAIKHGTQLISIKVEGNDYTENLNALESKVSYNAEDHITINLTGGNKMMALALYEFAKNAALICNVHHLYIDLKQHIHWYLKNTSDSFSEKITLEEFIELSGQKILSKEKYSDLEARFRKPLLVLKKQLHHFEGSKIWDNFLKTVIKKVRENSNQYETTKQVLKRLTVNGRLGEFNILWDNQGIQIYFKDKLMLEMHQSNKDIQWFLFNAGWFELVVAQKFSEKYNSEDIFMNVEFPSLVMEKTKKNEVDILINDGGKLVFIECKSGKVETKDIDRIKVRKETYGGLIGQNILVTRFPLTNEKIIIEKCHELAITTLPFKKL